MEASQLYPEKMGPCLGSFIVSYVLFKGNAAIRLWKRTYSPGLYRYLKIHWFVIIFDSI